MTDPLSAPWPTRIDIRRALVPTRAGQLHARLSGPGDAGARRLPLLLLLHMTPLSSAMYDPLLPRFGIDRLTVAPDRPGFGFSDAPDRPLSMAEYAAATLDLLDALDVPVCDVLGAHTGSVEAVELAAAFASRVRRLVLVSIPAYTPVELAERRYRLAGVPPPAEDGAHLQWHWQRRFLYRTPPHDLALFQWRLLQELLAGPNVWWPYQAVFDYPMAQRLAGLTQPVLVLAPHDDLWVQTERVRQNGGLPARAQFVDLPQSGLDITYFATDEVADLVRDFLDAPDQGAVASSSGRTPSS
ncbi:MAG TPA: alpha/beta hydrolase [Chloroflexota bacterium]|nr:alpha/beta hydrolase [Chloroflexota bacterium]